MSAINDNIIKPRVLLDADGDGFINIGVSRDTPPNLIKDQLYAAGAFATNYNRNSNSADTVASVEGQSTEPIDSICTTGRGLVNRRILLDTDINTVSGIGRRDFLKLLWRGVRKYQPSLFEAHNIFEAAANNYLSTNTAYGFAPLCKAMTLLDSVVNRGLMPDHVSERPRGSQYGDPSEQYGKDMGWIGEGAIRIPSKIHASLGGFAASIGYDGGRFGQYAWTQIGMKTGNYTYALTTEHASQWAGFPVTAGHTYTISWWTFVPATSLPTGAYSQITVENYLYADAPLGGDFQRAFVQYKATQHGFGFGIPYAGDWVRTTMTFTAPANSTHVGFDTYCQLNNMRGDVYIAGIMLTEATAANAPIRLNDPDVVYTADDFSYVFPADNEPYNFTFWVKSTELNKLSPKMYTVPIGTANVSVTTLSDITVNGDWSRVDIAIPADTVERGVALLMTPTITTPVYDGGYAKRAYLDLDGFMITKGSTKWPYHGGELYGYEDITDYVLNCRTTSGKDEFNAPLPNDGTATIVLNNDSKVFSPENAESPYFGYLQPNLKVLVQMADSAGDYQTIWAGWTTDIDVSAGRNLDRQGTITASQGIFRLAEGSLSLAIKTYQKMDAIARKVIAGSGWRTAGVVLQSYLGYHTKVGMNAFVDSEDLLFNTVEEGVNTVELAGKDWGASIDPRAALDQLLGAENATLFIERDGLISIYNRNHWITKPPDDPIVLDSNSTQAEYQYGADIINAVEVSVAKNKVLTNQTVWETKRPVPLSINQVWTVDLNPEFTEGSTKTVITYDLKNITKTVYLADIGLTNDTSQTASQAQSDAVRVELLGQAGNRPQVRLTNSNSAVMWVMLTVRGDYVDGGDTETVKVEDKESIDFLQGRHVLTYSSPVITTRQQAQAYGETILLRQSMPRGEFKTFTIIVRNTADLDRVHSLKVGDLVALSEVQSTQDVVSHGIIGEDWSVSNSRQLEVTYHVARTFEERFLKADLSVVKNDTINEIPDMSNAVPFGGGGTYSRINGTAYGQERAFAWTTGGGYRPALALNPSRQQVRNIPLTGALLYPATDGSGNLFLQTPTFQRPDERQGHGYSGRWRPSTTSGEVLWFRQNTRLTMTASGTAGAVIGGRRSKTTDDSVGAAAIWDLLIPVEPNELYEIKVHWLYGNVANLPAWFTHPPSDGANVTGSAIAALAKNGTLLKTWAGGSNTATRVNMIGDLLFIYYLLGEANAEAVHRFKAADANGGVTHTAIQLYKKANVMEEEGVHSVDLIRYSGHSKTGGVKLNTAVSHVYSVFTQIDYKAISPTELVLTVYAEDGSVIGTNTVSVNSSEVSKLSVNIPSGNKSAWATLSAPTTGVDTKIIILAYGITRNAVTAFTDLVEPLDHEVIFA